MAQKCDEKAKRNQPDLERPDATVKSSQPFNPPDEKASQAEEAVEAMEEASRRKPAR